MKKCFLDLGRANREYKTKIQATEGKPYRKSDDGTCLFIMADKIINKDGEEVDTVKRGQSIEIHPAMTCSLDADFNLLVDPNPDLYNYLDVQCVRVVQPGEEGSLILFCTAKKAFNLSKISYLIRLYLVGW